MMYTYERGWIEPKRPSDANHPDTENTFGMLSLFDVVKGRLDQEQDKIADIMGELKSIRDAIAKTTRLHSTGIDRQI